MRVLPRTVRQTWALAAAAWLVLCGIAWWVLPLCPRATCHVAHGDGLLAVFSGGRGAVTGPEMWDMRWEFLTGPLRYWHASTNQFTWFLSEQDQIEFGDTSPDGRWVVHRPRDNLRRLFLLDTTSGQTTFIAEVVERFQVRFSPDGRWLAFTDRVGNSDGIRLWDLSERRPGHVLSDAGDRFVFSPNGRWLASRSTRGSSPRTACRIWDVTAGMQRSTIPNPDGELIGDIIGFSADGACLIEWFRGSGFELDRYSCREIDSGRERWGVEGMAGDVVAGGRLFCCREYSDRSRWDMLAVLDITDGRVRSRLWIGDPCLISPDGRILVISDDRVDSPIFRWIEEHFFSLLPRYTAERMKLVDLPSGHVVATLATGPKVMFAPDGDTLAVLGKDNVVRLWDIPPRKSLAWFLAAAALLALPLAGLARRRVRALRRRAEAAA
jgi:hypothetical protein